jgi:hypothetical protein
MCGSLTSTGVPPTRVVGLGFPVTVPVFPRIVGWVFPVCLRGVVACNTMAKVRKTNTVRAFISGFTNENGFLE